MPLSSLAETRTATIFPTCAAVRLNVSVVMPVGTPFNNHILYVATVPAPLQVPAVDVSCCPTCGVPEIAGGTERVGPSDRSASTFAMRFRLAW